MIEKESTTLDEIESKLKDNGMGNHTDNLKVINDYSNYSSAKLNKEEFLSLVFLSNSEVRKIVPANGNRQLRALAGEAIKLLESGNSKLNDNWDLNSILKKFDAAFSNSKVDLNYLLLRETRNGERKYGKWYLQDGNHRALAYAIKILREELEYEPQKIYLAEN